ncbi:type IV toxin-antitoxin system AbiEi family antitoxin domain-containing protein [Gordonia sp. NPDC003424]
MHEFPTDGHGIIYRRTAIDHGYTDKQLARAVDEGLLERIWQGAFVVTPAKPLKPHELHRLTAVAVATLGDGSVLSHESAGLVHGLSLLHPRLGRVHIATGLATGGRIDTNRHLHSGTLDAGDVTTVLETVCVTTLERTAADIACSQSFSAALAVLDSALRLGADPDLIAAYLERHRRGVAQARRALAFADAGAENAGESWGRAQIIAAGLPVPRLQHKFYDHDGGFVGRCDYDWDAKLAAEFDGMVKYQRHLREGETPFDAMRREKAREDALRRLGIMVIRWIWDDLRNNRVVPMVREWLNRLGLVA